MYYQELVIKHTGSKSSRMLLCAFLLFKCNISGFSGFPFVILLGLWYLIAAGIIISVLHAYDLQALLT